MLGTHAPASAAAALLQLLVFAQSRSRAAVRLVAVVRLRPRHTRPDLRAAEWAAHPLAVRSSAIRSLRGSVALSLPLLRLWQRTQEDLGRMQSSCFPLFQSQWHSA